MNISFFFFLGISAFDIQEQSRKKINNKCGGV